MPAPGSSPETPFADLVSRYLDGTAGAAEGEALSRALLEDEACSREFASQMRFESMLRRTCRRDAKALFEFAALEAASDDSEYVVSVGEAGAVGLVPASAAMVAADARPAKRPVRWHTAAAPWLRVAAVFLALATSVALWFNREQQVLPAAQVAQVTPVTLQVQSITDDQMVLLAPRQQVEAVGTPKPGTAPEGPKALTLAERLEDFYLPAVHLHQVRAQDAADWLTAQLRLHNYAKRPDLNRLTLRLPSGVASRLVTLDSGPISFKKAVEIVATLAGGETVVGEDGIQIVARTTPASPAPPAWEPSPWGKDDTQQHADALGIALDDSMLKEEADGATSLRLPADQQRALGMLAQAEKRLDSLAPLSFVPLMVPAGAAGTERVLSASVIDSLRQQLAAAPNPGSLPTVTIPFGNGSQGASLLNGSGDTAISLKVTPVGEMNQVTIQPTTTTPVTPTTNLLTDNNTTTAPPARTDAVLDSNQGVVTTTIPGSSTTQYYTAEGIPIPPGYEFLFGIFAAPPEDGSESALVLVPVP